MNFKNKAKLKASLLSTAAIATSLLIGMAPACATKPEDGNDEDKTVTKQDVQIIKNANFEFYDDNDGLYPISSPDNWSSGSRGNSSAAMGGVIDTAKDRWDYFTDPELRTTLEKNNELNSDDENKKDYNGALADDLPYKNTHDAIKTDAKDDAKAYIDNPLTHKYEYDEEGELTTKTYEKDGKTYTDEECTKELETSVLMLHNYRSGYFKGTETYYSSSSSITLEARTAAKISVWVKTSELHFDGADNTHTKAVNEHGAYIQVETQVGSNSLDAFYIRNINTEQLNEGVENVANNGWIQYTVYVQASSFASTTVKLTLGLGQDDKYTVEGYAFFDDIELTTYENAEEMIAEANEDNSSQFDKLVKNSTANLLSPDGVSEFRVDKVSFPTNDENGNLADKPYENEYNSKDRHFYIDLTSSAQSSEIAFDAQHVSAGLTVEKTNTGRYVSAKPATDADKPKTNGITALGNGADNAYLPSYTFKGINVSKDILATIKNIGGENWKFPTVPNGTDAYNEILTNALKSASALPSANGNALVMLSANGAAYEAQLTNEAFKLEKDEYALLTFWVKTSDMDGKTAATITVKDVDDEDNSSNFTLDSTTIDTVKINENEDVYDGWVECFIRVENTSKQDKQFKLCFNFGNTTIKGTTAASYKAGWMTVTNASLMKLDKDVYSYTSGLSNSASLTLSDTEKTKGEAFDSEQGDKNVIKSDLAIPSSYTGVNGASAEVINLNDKISEYDETNKNPYAGLLNKENLANYKGCEWFSAIEALKKLNDDNADSVWNEFAGKLSTQPLLILNAKRSFDGMDEKIYNYGYIGSNSSVSSNGYAAVSVRVKVSSGAIASVYLVDTETSSKQVLGLSIPKYTFWYDNDGNILKGEPKDKASAAEMKENIAYTLRADGLYELNGESDGKLYANFYNLKKYYDYDLEYENFFDKDGNPVKFEDLVQGETYYANAKGTAYAPHYLVAGNNNKVYKYNAGLDGETTYYYMVSGKPDTNKVVYGVNSEKAALRYDNSEQSEYPYQFTIDATTHPEYVNKWVTVTFYLKAGSEAKNYKLELWSGYRDEQTTDGVLENSYVLFDYDSISLSESEYNERIEFYTNAIISEYQSKLEDETDKNSDSIADYESKFTAEEIKAIKEKAFNYDAKYYTYTLYDSASYVPFNSDTAKADETGYAYNYSDYSESLAYLKVADKIGDEFALAAFVDYSNFDKSISLGTQTTVDGSDDNNTSSTTSDSTNFWLLLASIILLAAILVAMLAIVAKDVIKRIRRNKTAGKNTYNFNKNKRYVRKYVKANGEVTKVEEGNVDESLLTDKVEETPVEEPVEETTATPTEEQTVEEPAEEVTENSVEESVEQAEPVEETHAEEVKAEPAEETQAEPVEETTATPAEKQTVEEPAEESSETPDEESSDDGENKE